MRERTATAESETVRDNAERARYELELDGTVIAILTYRRQGNVLWLMHAEVDRALEGRGYASRLTQRALDAVRERGLRVRPVCGFVVSYIRRHPQYADLLA